MAFAPAVAAWLAAALAAGLAAALAPAALAAGLAGAAVGLAELPQAASARLAEMARPMITVRCIGLPSGSGGAGGLRSIRRRQAPILRPSTSATCLPVLDAFR
jgi:hypothetical protein